MALGRPFGLLHFKDITAATNRRTMIAAIVPQAGAGHTLRHCHVNRVGPQRPAWIPFQAAALALSHTLNASFRSRGSDSNGAKSHVKGRSWDRLASQDLSPSVSQGIIWRYVAVDRRLGYA